MVVAARILSSQSRQALVAIPHFIQDGNGLKLSKGGQSQTGKTKHSQGAHHMELASARGRKIVHGIRHSSWRPPARKQGITLEDDVGDV
jgi:hypothetical protein